jgi:hypothetical protein
MLGGSFQELEVAQVQARVGRTLVLRVEVGAPRKHYVPVGNDL